jgi:uncharacterized protein YyaL (SSP411 family)
MGMLGAFRSPRIKEMWTDEADEVSSSADTAAGCAAEPYGPSRQGGALVDASLLKASRSGAANSMIGAAASAVRPSFRSPHNLLRFLLRYGHRESRRSRWRARRSRTWRAAASTTRWVVAFIATPPIADWLVPHFEKMLYDKAQLELAYLEAYQATGRDPSVKVAAQRCSTMCAGDDERPKARFYSATDADSEGVEGKFFVWSLGELRQLLGEDAELAISFWGATEQGNFEGNNILTQRRSFAEVAKESGKSEDELRAAIERCKSILYEARKKRVAPHLDDKILSSWNGLMLSAFAQAARWLDGEQAARYRQIAQRNAAFLLDQMRRDDGRMWRTRRGEHAHVEAFLEDYAFVARGLVDLFEVDSDPRWLEAALALQKHMDAHFVDKDTGGYFSTADYHEQLVTRMGSAQESSMPSDEGVAAELAYRLGMLTGNEKLIERGQQVLRRHGGELAHFPNAYGQLLLTADFALAEPEEAIVIGPAQDPRTQALLRALRSEWPRYRLIVHVEPSQRAQLEPLMPTLEGKSQVDGKPAAWICRLGVCKAPITDPSGL